MADGILYFPPAQADLGPAGSSAEPSASSQVNVIDLFTAFIATITIIIFISTITVIIVIIATITITGVSEEPSASTLLLLEKLSL